MNSMRIVAIYDGKRTRWSSKWEKYCDLFELAPYDENDALELVLRRTVGGHRELLCLQVKNPSGELITDGETVAINMRAVLDVPEDEDEAVTEEDGA